MCNLYIHRCFSYIIGLLGHDDCHELGYDLGPDFGIWLGL